MARILLSIQGITKSFSHRPLFQDLSFGLFEGEAPLTREDFDKSMEILKKGVIKITSADGKPELDAEGKEKTRPVTLNDLHPEVCGLIRFTQQATRLVGDKLAGVSQK